MIVLIRKKKNLILSVLLLLMLYKVFKDVPDEKDVPGEKDVPDEKDVPGEKDVPDEKDGLDEPLFLTPLIEKGRIAEARSKSFVKPFVKGIESYAGYLTVNKIYNSNLFFWFFKAQSKDWEKLPVTVWLQGGPGVSSFIAILLENGPYILKNGKLHIRHESWHTNCNMIYIDCPVGTGFSFTDSDYGYARTRTDIGEQLYTAISQFFKIFPNFVKNDFFIAGESYGGKFVLSFAYAIYKNNLLAHQKVENKNFINLKGLCIGNGQVDPVNMMEYGDYLYQLGLIDTNTKRIFHTYDTEIREKINNKHWIEATRLYSKLISPRIFYPYFSLYQNATGRIGRFNYVNKNPPYWNCDHIYFVNSNLLKRSVHVGYKSFIHERKVALILIEDITKSAIDIVEELVKHYRILFYNGQWDVSCAYPLTINFIKKLKWKSAQEYASAPRHIWRVNNDVAGYYKTAGNLTEVLVRNSGHFVPIDQPLWAYIIFNKFIQSKELND